MSSDRKKFNGISKDMLIKAGYAPNPDGSWSKGPPPVPTTERKPRPKEIAPKSGARYLALCTVVTVRPRDYDGLGAACKAILDRLVELKRIPVDDDDPDSMEVVTVARRCQHFKDQKTVIEIYSVS